MSIPILYSCVDRFVYIYMYPNDMGDRDSGLLDHPDKLIPRETSR
jgi:hypothetical protein